MGLFSFLRPEPTPNEMLARGIQDNLASSCEEALRAGADPNRVIDHRGFNLLHWVCCKGYAPIAQCLLDHGADPNYRNPVLFGQSHVALAVTYEHLDVLEVLLRAGADPNLGRAWLEGGKEETPLRFARKRARIHDRSHRVLDERIIALLQQYGGVD